ncbi:tkl protein kinase [Plasmopara halstedii]|uniref:Tkl protein kinase n=1 Tax=Plasmopara halstedii TaxID=4781 RepID=A0A0N7L7X0_PLAHL|nr:tkl protein kinase [Plasmopara halstedii]CEG48251.1 tkl protein kinase [Plasmopara halstedii]|eukprot:XP_024584620.1 tkl protein kinase [Plasmopara halstedii]
MEETTESSGICDYVATMCGIDMAHESESSRCISRGRTGSKTGDLASLRTCAFCNGDSQCVMLESLYAAHQFMFVFVLMLMFEKSLSYPAVKRAFGISLILSYYSTIYVWAVTTFGRLQQQQQFTIGLQL